MITGITASRVGITYSQEAKIENLLRDDNDLIRELRHGDCIGGDADIHDITERVGGYRIILHPPDRSVLRAFKKAFKTMPEKDYITRNRDIVNASDRIIAAPKEYVEQLRSGTWSTIRYARQRKKKLIIVYPDGTTGV